VASTIGIKIANGEFYSILEEYSQVKKRLILTTVHDMQESVQIDLYKSLSRSLSDAKYIGSLVMENIRPRPRGEPSIELVLVSTKDGVITADAVDLDSSVDGEHQLLNVSLKSLDEDNREYELPDFELEHNEAPPRGLYEKAAEKREEKTQKFPWLLVVCGALVVTAIGLALWLFFFRSGSAPAARPAVEAPAAQTQQPAGAPAAAPAPAPAAQAQPAAQPAQAPVPAAVPAAVPAPAPAAQPAASPGPAAPAASPVPAAQPAAPPVIQAPASAPASQGAAAARRTRPVPPVASYKVPSVIPKEGAPYRIRYGDTLWDIAEAFYRNPWLYPRIARFNNIRNPDLIISGRTIRIPPRN